MEPYWNYEDVGIYILVLVFVGMVVRLAVKLPKVTSTFYSSLYFSLP